MTQTNTNTKRRNNTLPWSCPLCDFEGTVRQRVDHLEGHE